VNTAKEASYTESVNLDGVTRPLAGIAHNPGNKLSTWRQADFSLDGGPGSCIRSSRAEKSLEGGGEFIDPTRVSCYS